MCYQCPLLPHKPFVHAFNMLFIWLRMSLAQPSSDSSVGQVLVGGWPSITLACLPSQPSWRLETLLTFVVASDTYTFTRLGHSLRRCKNPQAREVRLFTRSPNHNKPYIHL